MTKRTHAISYHVVSNGNLLAYHDTLEYAKDFAKQYSSHGTLFPVRIFDATGQYVCSYEDGKLMIPMRPRR